MQVNEKFLDSLYQEFPFLQREELVDITNEGKFATLEDISELNL